MAVEGFRALTGWTAGYINSEAVDSHSMHQRSAAMVAWPEDICVRCRL